MKSVTIVSEDRVGLLADISYILGKSNLNIDGLFVDVVGGKAVICLEVRDPSKAADVLANNGFKTAAPDAIIVKVSNDSLGELTDLLEGEDVVVTSMDSLSHDDQDAIFAISVDKPRKASKMLSNFLLGNLQAPSCWG